MYIKTLKVPRTMSLIEIDIPTAVIGRVDSQIQWNLIIKRSDITKLSYNKVILLVPALYISMHFTLI